MELKKQKFNPEGREKRRKVFDQLSPEEGRSKYSLSHFVDECGDNRIRSFGSVSKYLQSWGKSVLVDENQRLTQKGMNAKKIYQKVEKSPFYLTFEESLPEDYIDTYNAGLIDIIPLGVRNGEKEVIISKDESKVVPECESQSQGENAFTMMTLCAIGIAVIPLAVLVSEAVKGYLSEI